MYYSQKPIIINDPSDPTLATKIAKLLHAPRITPKIQYFADGEIAINLSYNLKHQKIFIIYTAVTPIHKSLLQLLLISNAVQNHQPLQITAIMPYFPYARQHHPIYYPNAAAIPTPLLDPSHYPNIAQLPAQLLTKLLLTAGISRIITVDLHDPTIIPLQLRQQWFNLSPIALYAIDFLQHNYQLIHTQHKRIIVVAPDHGSRQRAVEFATLLEVPYLWLRKQRANNLVIIEPTNATIKLQNAICIIIDDLIDSGNTICNTAAWLKEHGAAIIIAYCTHAVFSQNLGAKISDPPINQFIVSNSMPLATPIQRQQLLGNNKLLLVPPSNTRLQHNKIRTVDLAPLLARYIRKINRLY